jgi:hypothetical protein
MITALLIGIGCGIVVVVVVGILRPWFALASWILRRWFARAKSWAKRMMRYAKAAATDKRLPRPVRWLFVAGLAVKCLPVDFGLDELLLGTGIVLLATRYRKVWAEIRADLATKEEP